MEFKTVSFRYACLLYFDTAPYLADKIFAKHGVKVHFNGEFEIGGTPYLAIRCYVRKRDVHKFFAALEDLEKEMRIRGHRDYRKVATNYMTIVNTRVETRRQLLDSAWKELWKLVFGRPPIVENDEKK